ncbi:hypothetical protein SBADM41S_11127 [Streptomyces badius]
MHHPVFARFYARLSVAADLRGGVAAYREELLAGLSGRVIEIGAGKGLNFADYPGAVSEVVALEPERSLRQLAVRSALRAEVPVDVVPGAAEALPVKVEAFDAAVASLVLCTVRDLPRALAEIGRVLRPGGELRFFEHGLARGRALAAASGWRTGRCGRSSSAAVTPRGIRWPRSRRRASSWGRTAGCGSRRRVCSSPRRRAFWAWPVSRSPRTGAEATGRLHPRAGLPGGRGACDRRAECDRRPGAADGGMAA